MPYKSASSSTGLYAWSLCIGSFFHFFFNGLEDTSFTIRRRHAAYDKPLGSTTNKFFMHCGGLSLPPEEYVVYFVRTTHSPRAIDIRRISPLFKWNWNGFIISNGNF